MCDEQRLDHEMRYRLDAMQWKALRQPPSLLHQVPRHDLSTILLTVQYRWRTQHRGTNSTLWESPAHAFLLEAPTTFLSVYHRHHTGSLNTWIYVPATFSNTNYYHIVTNISS